MLAQDEPITQTRAPGDVPRRLPDENNGGKYNAHLRNGSSRAFGHPGHRPKQLPKLGSALGKTVKGLREGLGSNEQDAEETEQESAVEALEEAPKQKPAPKKTAAQSE